MLEAFMWLRHEAEKDHSDRPMWGELVGNVWDDVRHKLEDTDPEQVFDSVCDELEAADPWSGGGWISGMIYTADLHDWLRKATDEIAAEWQELVSEGMLDKPPAFLDDIVRHVAVHLHRKLAGEMKWRMDK